ncbi:hypothetical protein HDV02_004410 [Globomyces sp. JEL0801]|nr:hypothetical protein HDV02_004410 [Globomyces sp. JEL0801]
MINPILAILPITALSDIVLQSQWMYSNNCQGPPSTMFLFEHIDLNENIPQKNETWPSYYEFTMQEFPPGFCGNMYNPIYSGCCYTSLDLDASLNYQSGAPYLLGNEDYKTAVSLQANGKTYCKILSPNLPSFDGFSVVFILNDSKCYEDYYSCDANGRFLIYSEKRCKGITEEFQLNTAPNTFLTSDSHSFGANLEKVENGKEVYFWNAFTPSSNLIPFTGVFWDNLFLAVMILSIVLLSIASFISIRNYAKSKSKNVLLIAISLIFFVIVAAIDMFYYCNIYYSVDIMRVHEQLIQTFTGLSMLFITMLNTNQLFRFEIPFISQKLLYPTHIATCIIHLIFNGGKYFRICYIISLKCFISRSSILKWSSLSVYWSQFMFFWNLVPISCLVFYVCSISMINEEKRTILNIFRKLYRLCGKFCLMVIVEAVLIFASYFLNWLAVYSDSLGSDRASLCVSGIRRLTQYLIYIMNLWIVLDAPQLFAKIKGKPQKATAIASSTTKEAKE